MGSISFLIQGRAQGMVTPILTTKLRIPSLRRSLVPRQRLLDRLDVGVQRRLTLVSAPAGFGKTTLLSEWSIGLQAASSPHVKVAWISLDDGDNDPARFSAYLVAAFRWAEERDGRTDGNAPQSTGSLLQEPQLTQWINRVAGMPQSFVLVLDDYHLITSRVIHEAVAYVVDHLPENLHVVLATRADPPLPLPRLRARGHLVELRQNDLRFTPQEAAAFLNHVMGLNLSAEDVAALEARTEGWIAGLQMAAISLQGHSPDPAIRSRFVRDLTGSHRFILDYLVEEVLEQLTPALQQFLLSTSILDRFTGLLCDAVMGSLDTEDEGIPSDTPPASFADSQSILEHLEASNLFIVPLDDERRWYRYHRLFADLLRKRLWHVSPDRVPVLHRRASTWHEQEGLMASAIHHALAAHDSERAANLIEASAEATLMRSEVTTFLNWMGELADGLVRARPTLCFYHAWALLMSGQPLDTVEESLQQVASVQDAPANAARMAALHAYRMLFQADTHQAGELGRQALEQLPEGDRFLRHVVAWIVSLASLADGDLQKGSQALQEVARMGQEMQNPLIAVAALCHLAKLQARQGHLYQARETLERALHVATDPQGRRLPIASKPLIGLGELEREWNELEAAEDHLAEGIELSKQWSALATFDAYFPLARIRQAQGDAVGAREALAIAQRIARRSEVTAVDDLVADLQLAYLSAAQGDIDGVMRWAEARGLPTDGPVEALAHLDEGEDPASARLRKYEYPVLARLLILQGRTAAALELLEALLAQARQRGRVDLTIAAQILRALAYQLQGQEDQAIDALTEALSLAEPGGYVRVFADEGAPMVRLLSQATSRGVHSSYVAKLAAAFARPVTAEVEAEPQPPPTQLLAEPLSERELEVLRLLATGLSNPEIADELVIAVSTVRSHCKSIYGKLNVHRRWDAVNRGSELGLI